MSAQIKILYGSEYSRCKTTTISMFQLKSLGFDALKSILQECVGGFYQDARNIRIQYREDEGTFVTISNETDVQDAIRCCKPIVSNTAKESNTVRMGLRVDDALTPVSSTNRHPPSPEENVRCWS